MNSDPTIQAAAESIDMALARQFDMACTVLMNECCAGPWGLADARDRLVIHRQGGTDTIYLDAKPILRFHPLEITTVLDDGKYVVRATRKVERL